MARARRADELPLVVGEIVGWRAWQIVGTMQVPRLMSVTAPGVPYDDRIWPTNRWFEAKCIRKGHVGDEIPGEKCRCGLYAAKDRDHLVQLAYGAYGHDDVTAIGRVAFAGKVIPGSQGWKAQKGRVLDLIVPSEYWRWAAPLEEAYRVPVTTGFLFSDAERRRVLGQE